MENKKFSVELGEMFGAIVDKITTATDNGYKAISDRFATIKKLRDEINEEYTELKTIRKAVHDFANTINKNNENYNQATTETEDGLDILDDLDDCFVHEIGTCAECGRVIMSDEEDKVIVGSDGQLYCDDDCYDQSMIIGTCDYCGGDIYEEDDWVENEDGFFCSDDCANMYSDYNSDDENEEETDEDEEVSA
jgi:hypothetical protein